MVDKLNMSLFELRAYKAWLERSRDAFAKAYPDLRSKNEEVSAKRVWYSEEIANVAIWIESAVRRKVAQELDVEARKFLNPQPVTMVTKVRKPDRFTNLKYKIQDFFYDIFGGR